MWPSASGGGFNRPQVAITSGPRSGGRRTPFLMSDDKLLASAHEAAHHTVAQHLGTAWSAAWIWPGRVRWDGLCRYARVEPTLQPLIAAAGGAGEGLLHGKQHPSDLREFVMAEDAAAMGDDLEGALKYAQFVLGGQCRTQWLADTGLLYTDLVVGEWRRSRQPPPPEWLAADSALQKRANKIQDDPDPGPSIVQKLLRYLDENCNPSGDQLGDIQAILSGDDPDAESGVGMDARRRVRMATDARYLQRFPNAHRLVKRF
jgi:hypothetical protein